jgi:hypothetical protein
MDTMLEDTVTVTFPRPVLTGLAGISASITDRLHALLEKNTEGVINATEKQELEGLVRIAQVDQIVTMALQLPRIS